MQLTFRPDWRAATSAFRHTWEGLGNVDQFRWLVREDQRRQLAMARDELGLREVRACAMYSPEMRILGYGLPDWRLPAAEKSKRANWQNVDYCLEGLLELGLKPLYTTSFMPADFTDSQMGCWPDGNRIGMPRDLVQWREFVAAGIRHHIGRFGLDEVRSWRFECWNEPNLAGSFFDGTREDFQRLWSATWRAIKSVHPDLRIGGPSTARGEWIEAFLDDSARDGTPPDYLISHVYNNDSGMAPLSPFDGPASHQVKDSPHFAAGVVRGVRRTLDRRGWRGEVQWNEWGRSWFPHDPLKETALEAAFIGKTMAEVSQEADAFAFWCLSDIYDQCGYQSSEFQGNYGMLSLHGLRKPAWNAHAMLCRLGRERLPVTGGDELSGAVATRDGREAAVLIWLVPGQSDAAPSSVDLDVRLPAGASRPQLLRIGAQENNIVAAWRAMGAPTYPTRRQLDDLRAQDRLRPVHDVVLGEAEGELHARFSLERPGLALLSMHLPDR